MLVSSAVVVVGASVAVLLVVVWQALGTWVVSPVRMEGWVTSWRFQVCCLPI